MGRHTKLEHLEDEATADDAGGSARPSPADRPVKVKIAIPVPLLPIVAAVIAVGVVAYAFSTTQISLNFGGSGGAHVPQAVSPRDSQVSQRNPGERTSRGGARSAASGLVVAFQVSSKTATAFKGTAIVTNRGTKPAAAWTLGFSFPNATVRALSGGTVVRTGKVGWLRSPAGAPALVPGQSIKVAFTARGTAARPAACKLNGADCTFA